MKKFKKILVICMCALMMLPITAFTNIKNNGEEMDISAIEKIDEDSINKNDSYFSLVSESVPSGQYGQNITMKFKIKNKAGQDMENVSIVPLFDADSAVFPFEITKIEEKEIGNIAPLSMTEVSYEFTIRQDVNSGYSPVGYIVSYNFPGEKVERKSLKTLYVKLEGKPQENTEVKVPATEEPMVETPIVETPAAEDTAVSVPRLIVTGYETVPEKVIAGQDFKLIMHVKNTSNRTAISNIKINLSSEANEFLPKSGSNTVFIQSIGKGATSDISIDMNAQSELLQKPYVLLVKAEYEDSSVNQYTADESVSIPVYQEARLNITDVEISPEELSVGEEANIMFSIYNLGKGILYNTSVSVESSSLKGGEQYIGNIASGASGNADVMVTAVDVLEDGKIKLVVSYEDASGEVFTFEEEANLVVLPEYETYDVLEEDMMEYEEVGNPIGFILAFLVIVIVVVVVIIVVIILIVKKHKKKGEEIEDEI